MFLAIQQGPFGSHLNFEQAASAAPTGLLYRYTGLRAGLAACAMEAHG